MLAAALDRCHGSRRRGWDTQLLGDKSDSVGVAASSLLTSIMSRLQGDESYETETRKCVSWLHLNRIGISTAVCGSDGLTSSQSIISRNWIEQPRGRSIVTLWSSMSLRLLIRPRLTSATHSLKIFLLASPLIFS